MRFSTLAASFLVLFPALAFSAETSNPLMASSEAFYSLIKGDVLKSAEKMPEENYSFRPVDSVRTYGQILAHIADAQFTLCGIIATGKPVMKGYEKTAKTKAEIIAALKDGFAYCDAQYKQMTDADAATMVAWFGRKSTKLSVLDFNIAHGFEHYGNLVTYMRIKGIVPPSSEQAR